MPTSYHLVRTSSQSFGTCSSASPDPLSLLRSTGRAELPIISRSTVTGALIPSPPPILTLGQCSHSKAMLPGATSAISNLRGTLQSLVSSLPVLSASSSSALGDYVKSLLLSSMPLTQRLTLLLSPSTSQRTKETIEGKLPQSCIPSTSKLNYIILIILILPWPSISEEMNGSSV